MSRFVSALALVSLAGFTAAAAAQSSVTVFGVIDLAATHVDNGDAPSLTSLSQDGQASSRLGFRGVEDLGGGLRAGFWLEGAVGADTGCGGPSLGAAPTTSCGHTWQRRSTVSLMGPFGELRLGRDYVPTFWNFVEFTPFGYNGIGSPAATASTLNSGATTLVRANNTVGYFLPALGGLYGQLQLAAGEGATGNKSAGARVGYRIEGLNVAASFGRTDRTGPMGDDFTLWSVGGAFQAGVVLLQAYFGRHDHLDRGQRQAVIGASVPVGSTTLKASYTRSRGDLGTGGRSLDADQIALGAVHDLSKRTALYGTFARIDNQGSGASGALFQLGNGSLDGFAGGQASQGVQAGLRHSF